MTTQRKKLFARLTMVLCSMLCLGALAAAAETDSATPPGKQTNAKDPPSEVWLDGTSAVTPFYVFHSAVNDPSADTTIRDTQNDTTLVDLGAGHVVAAFNDSGSLNTGNHLTGFAYSDSNGVGWTDGGALPSSTAGDAGQPVLAYGRRLKRVYLATRDRLYHNTIQVFRSNDMGHTWEDPVNGSLEDIAVDLSEPWITVDNYPGSGNGNVYLCQTYADSLMMQDIKITRSTDGGATFTSSFHNSNLGKGRGCNIVVTPRHQVLVFSFFGSDYEGEMEPGYLTMHRSTDHGMSFSYSKFIASLQTRGAAGNQHLKGGLPSNSYPQVAVNPVAGRDFIYVVYNDGPDGDSDIWMIFSTDGGNTWSVPLRVNDDTAGDQFSPNIAFVSGGGKLMISYYSRSQDPQNLMYHRRARVGTLTSNGSVNFQKSFQLSPNMPIVYQDRAIYSPLSGNLATGGLEGIAGGSGSVKTTWSDNRSGNKYHANQADVRFASIAVPTPTTDLGVTISATPSRIGLGQNTVFTVTASAAGGRANDVFVNATMPLGLAVQSATSAGGSCSFSNGMVGCSLGTINAGASKSIQIVAMGVYSGGKRVVTATGTTSSNDTHPANDTASADVAVTGGGVVVRSVSSGNIAVPIIGQQTYDIPLTVPFTGTLINAAVHFRLNHNYDGNLEISLVSPTGKIVSLSNDHGHNGKNYGSGPNNCFGDMTTLVDINPTPIVTAAAPFTGNFKPDGLIADTFGSSMDGIWKLRVRHIDVLDNLGIIGCFSLSLQRIP